VSPSAGLTQRLGRAGQQAGGGALSRRLRRSAADAVLEADGRRANERGKTQRKRARRERWKREEESTGGGGRVI
jgi:hypothetical protein